MTPKENLDFVIKKMNNQTRRVQQILERVQHDTNLLTYSDKSELKEIAQRYLLNMTSVSSIIESNPFLIIEDVPFFDKQISADEWMKWTMQWFDDFEKSLKTVLLN